MQVCDRPALSQPSEKSEARKRLNLTALLIMMSICTYVHNYVREVIITVGSSLVID